MSAMASLITGVSIVYSTVCSDADQRKHQSSASLAFVKGIPQWPGNSPHKGPGTRKLFSFDDIIMVVRWEDRVGRSSVNISSFTVVDGLYLFSIKMFSFTSQCVVKYMKTTKSTGTIISVSIFISIVLSSLSIHPSFNPSIYIRMHPPIHP